MCFFSVFAAEFSGDFFDTVNFYLYNSATMDRKNDKDKEEDVVLEKETADDDASFELTDASVESQKKIQQLRKKLSEAEQEKRKFHEELQRARADFLNSKRRLEQQFASAKERATDAILRDLLTLADSFDTAMADKERWEAVDEKWRMGIEGIYSKLKALMSQYGIFEIDPLGELFDPEQHEAISNAHVEKEGETDRVMSVVQKGYKRDGEILRPAKVIVGTKA